MDERLRFVARMLEGEKIALLCAAVRSRTREVGAGFATRLLQNGPRCDRSGAISKPLASISFQLHRLGLRLINNNPHLLLLGFITPLIESHPKCIE